MRKLLISVASLIFVSKVFATVDTHDQVYLVVKDIQSEEYFVERAPVIGCHGLTRGPHLVQFTSEYKVNSNIGCGGETVQDNINYLTCAKLVSSKESADYTSFSEITLDISQCADKSNPKLITMIRAAAKLNFPNKKGEVKLTILK